MYTELISGLIFPLQERLKSHDTVRVRRALEQSQWWEPSRLAQHQADRLRTLLMGIGRDVPYYRQLFAERGFEPSKVTSTSDLLKLPLLDKPTIRANVEAMKRPGAVGLARSNTGGSSGEPLVFYLGKQRVSHDVAAKWRATRWWGVDIGDPEIVVWGSPIELGAQDGIRHWRDRLMRSQLLPAFDMGERALDVHLDTIRKRRPRMLFGYPSALSHIAQHAQRRGVDMKGLGIRVAFVTSERLYDNQRAMIEDVFGCPVANGYGGRDAGFLAHECPSGGMHITAEDVIIEILDADGAQVADGQPGEIVVTHLDTADFPFVRYRTGDIAVRNSGRCACGRGLPLLQEIQGRTTDFVVTAEGAVMHGLALIYVLRDIEGLRQFKIIQHSQIHTQVLIQPSGVLNQQSISSAICDGFRRRLGSSVRVEVTWVADIPAEKSGKHRYIVSHVPARPGDQVV